LVALQKMGLKIGKYFIETKLNTLIAIRDIVGVWTPNSLLFYIQKCVNLITRLLEKKNI